MVMSLEFVEAPPRAVTLKRITNSPTSDVLMVMDLHASVFSGVSHPG